MKIFVNQNCHCVTYYKILAEAMHLRQKFTTKRQPNQLKQENVFSYKINVKCEMCCCFAAGVRSKQGIKKVFETQSSASASNRFLCFVLIKAIDEKDFSYR